MVDTSSGGIAKLPPEERLKRARALEAEKRRELEHDISGRKKALEDELARKKKELEELEKRTKKEIEDAASLEKRTLEEITRERVREVATLEAQVKKFREGSDFVPEGGAAGPSPSAEAASPAVQYRPPPGFGQGGGAVEEAKQHLDYLLHASTMSPEGRHRAESGLYQSLRTLQGSLQEGMHDHRPVDESYAFNQVQERIRELKERGWNDANGYMARTENVLNRLVTNPTNEFDLIDYRSEDERRRRR